MNVAPKLSILTTIYNREPFIAECIESVQCSKFKDYEHILVDDQSSDRSVEIAESYAVKDSRITIHKNPNNLGDYPNRNKAASLARGKYIKYVDADDMIGPWMLSIMVDAMETHPGTAAGLFVYGPHKSYLPRKIETGQSLIEHYIDGSGILNRSPLGAIIDREKFNAVNGFPSKQHVGDFELWHKLGALYPLLALPTLLSNYRIHPGQQSEDNRKDFTVPFKYFEAALDGLKFARKQGFSHPNIEAEILRSRSRTVLHAIKQLHLEKARVLKSKSGQTWMDLIRHARA
ncbi:glycosyltransferase family 2 protein [Flavobacteriales bacterium]|nr:glycosyltransferase family 2 protein [Flavobacteriales bacterium]